MWAEIPSTCHKRIRLDDQIKLATGVAASTSVLAFPIALIISLAVSILETRINMYLFFRHK